MLHTSAFTKIIQDYLGTTLHFVLAVLAGTGADEVSYCQRRGECGGGLWSQRAGTGNRSV